MQNKKEPEARRETDLFIEDTSEASKIDYLELLYHLVDKLPKILLVGFLCAAVVFSLVFFVETPKYQATTKLYVRNGESGAGGIAALVTDFQVGNYLTNDYRQIFTNKDVHELVLAELEKKNFDTAKFYLDGGRVDYQKLESMLNIANPSDTRVLTLTVTSEDENEAEAMAELYRQKAQVFIEDNMEMAQPPVFEKVHTNQVSKGTVVKTLQGFGLAVLAMVVVYVIQFLTDDRITTSDFIEKRVGIVTLGMMPVIDLGDDDPAASAAGKRKNARK